MLYDLYVLAMRELILWVFENQKLGQNQAKSKNRVVTSVVNSPIFEGVQRQVICAAQYSSVIGLGFARLVGKVYLLMTTRSVPRRLSDSQSRKVLALINEDKGSNRLVESKQGKQFSVFTDITENL